MSSSSKAWLKALTGPVSMIERRGMLSLFTRRPFASANARTRARSSVRAPCAAANSSRVKWRRSAIGVLPSSSMSGNRPDVFEPRRTTMVTSMISFGSAGPTLTAPARAARSLPGNSILVFFVAMTPSLIHVSPERTLFRSQSTGAGVSVKISGMPIDCACHCLLMGRPPR